MSAEAPLTKAERLLGAVLRLTALGLFVAALAYFLGPFAPPSSEFFGELPFVANSVVKVTILGLISLYAAGDVRRRRGLVAILIGAHVVSVAAMGSMLLFAETGTEADLGFAHPSVETVLWYAIGLDGLITVAIAGFFVAALRSARLGPRRRRQAQPLIPAERLLRWVLVAFALLFALGAAAYEIAPFLETSEELARELPFVTNSVVWTATMAMLGLYAAADPKRNMALAGPMLAALGLSVAAGGTYLIHQYASDPSFAVPLFGGEARMTTLLWAQIGHGALAGAILFAALSLAWRRRYGLGYLWPSSYRGLLACAEVLIGGDEERVPAADAAARVESFLQGFRAERRWLQRLALFAIEYAPLVELRPVPRLNPPLSELDRESRRRFLEAHFERLPRQVRWRFAKNVKQIVIRVCQQMSYAGYYGDSRSFESIGYQPFTARERYASLAIEEPGEHPLEVERPDQVGAGEIEADVCIVGSGAGGAVLAHELARRGRDVLILERGEYVEPREFNESEIEMISRLYAGGLLQLTEDWRFNILQGRSVGGSTTVNNAVCFPPPEPALAGWNDPQGNDAGLDLADLRRSVAAVEELIGVRRQAPDVPLNPSGEVFERAAQAHGAAAATLEVDAVRANIDGCHGSGYCNIGCRWGKKLSMLDRVLPEAQRLGAGSVRIIAECEVERLQALSGRPSRVTGLLARFPDGRRLRVRADEYAISAGAVASSYLLLRSGIGRHLPVGTGFSANMGVPLLADLDGDAVRSYDGLQISHYGVPAESGFVFETWFNPPVSQALNMPGWFEEHAENMRRYDHLMAVGVLVGTASNGQVKRALTGGPGVDFRPRPQDLRTMARGLKLLGEILFAAEPRPKRLMLNTWGREEFTSPDELGRLDEICQDPDYITLGTGHPQGGNVLSRNPRRGVVDDEFRVHGFDNLRVCDASVFPSSLTVNPQLTVMSLAHYAAARIGG